LISAEDLKIHIRRCAGNDRESQKKLYTSFYGYGMAICERYTKRKEDAMEIYNDSFLKIFKEIHRYKPSYENEMNSFIGWIRKIIIYTAIDHNRKYYKQNMTSDGDSSLMYIPAQEENALDAMSYEEIIHAIGGLSPVYRTVLNMFIVDGFSHEEISNQLGIAVGTSKSNLFKAKLQLQKILKKSNKTFDSEQCRTMTK
jgi:RNA polymerase sigma-70 factor (ECF subfamily)